MRYLVIIRKTRTGYSADVPDLPGCVAADTTVERTRKSITKAMHMHLILMRESNERIPLPRKRKAITADTTGNEEFYTWIEVDMKEAAAL
jgi:predicted RNase H-like HicB family nuclease